VRVRVSAVTETEIEPALSSSFKDFEDGIQHFVAKTEGGVSATVTRDKTDYASGEITVMSPDEFLAMREPSRDEGPTR
jgi:hypothetical protein